MGSYRGLRRSRCVDLHARIKVRMKDGIRRKFHTWAGHCGAVAARGRCPLNSINRGYDQKEPLPAPGGRGLSPRRNKGHGHSLCDRLKDLGYEFATQAGVTIGSQGPAESPPPSPCICWKRPPTPRSTTSNASTATASLPVRKNTTRSSMSGPKSPMTFLRDMMREISHGYSSRIRKNGS